MWLGTNDTNYFYKICLPVFFLIYHLKLPNYMQNHYFLHYLMKNKYPFNLSASKPRINLMSLVLDPPS